MTLAPLLGPADHPLHPAFASRRSGLRRPSWPPRDASAPNDRLDVGVFHDSGGGNVALHPHDPKLGTSVPRHLLSLFTLVVVPSPSLGRANMTSAAIAWP